MKKIFFSIICVCALISVGMTYSSYQTLGKYSFLFFENIEALTTEEGPGPWNPNWVDNPGVSSKDGYDRRKLPIDCSYGIGGDHVKLGCCLGMDNCLTNSCDKPKIKGC